MIHPESLTDRHENVLVWYLPDILLEPRKVSVETELVAVELKVSPKKAVWNHMKLLNGVLRIDAKSTNWRIGPMYYAPCVDPSRKCGAVSMSPGWFQQGHEVGGLECTDLYSPLSM